MSLRPERFEELLEARLGRGYRLRQSRRTKHWMVERKVARAIDGPINDDATQRLVDGYSLVLQWAPEPFLICDQCYLHVQLPVMQIGEVECTYCKSKGNDRTMWFDGWFPLSERTIEYLEQGAPKRAKERLRELEAQEERRIQSERRTRFNILEAIALERWNRVSGALQFGYTKAGTPHSYGD